MAVNCSRLTIMVYQLTREARMANYRKANFSGSYHVNFILGSLTTNQRRVRDIEIMTHSY